MVIGGDLEAVDIGGRGAFDPGGFSRGQLGLHGGFHRLQALSQIIGGESQLGEAGMKPESGGLYP